MNFDNQIEFMLRVNLEGSTKAKNFYLPKNLLLNASQFFRDLDNFHLLFLSDFKSFCITTDDLKIAEAVILSIYQLPKHINGPEWLVKLKKLHFMSRYGFKINSECKITLTDSNIGQVFSYLESIGYPKHLDSYVMAALRNYYHPSKYSEREKLI